LKAEAENRKCIVLGEVGEKDNLLRFTEVDGSVVPDFNKKLFGRGIYVSNSVSALTKAIDKKLFSKAAKKKLNEDKVLISVVENLLKKKGLETVNLAKKAGILITGFEKVKEVLIKNKAAFILEAKDAGDDGHKRVASLAKDLRVFSLYTTEELDKALDKVNTVHVAFKQSKMSETVYKDLDRYEKFLNS
jgi:predicted RNA-binding protein YlxR (DUF448 family)